MGWLWWEHSGKDNSVSKKYRDQNFYFKKEIFEDETLQKIFCIFMMNWANKLTIIKIY